RFGFRDRARERIEVVLVEESPGPRGVPRHHQLPLAPPPPELPPPPEKPPPPPDHPPPPPLPQPPPYQIPRPDRPQPRRAAVQPRSRDASSATPPTVPPISARTVSRSTP